MANTARPNMGLFEFFLLLLCEKLINAAQLDQEHSNKTEEIIISEALIPADVLNYPRSGDLGSENHLSRPTSVWGCDKYSSAFYDVTKKAIRFANEVKIYLQSGNNDTEEFSNVFTPSPAKVLKLNVLHKGVDFYRDFSLVVQALWRDFKNAVSMLGNELSTELEHELSRLSTAQTLIT